MRSSANAEPASERAAFAADASPDASLTTRIPLPPPPAAAFIMTGNPIRSASATISLSLASGRSPPGTTGMPAATIVFRACILSPTSAIVRLVGPMKTTPASSQALANPAFSARKP
jgi:hypothetical protein